MRTVTPMPFIEFLEARQLLSATLQPNYTGSLAVTRSAAATLSLPSRRLDLDITVSTRGAQGQITGDLSAGQLGVFAFEGSARGKNIELIFEDNSGDAGVLTATLSRNGSTLAGRWNAIFNSTPLAASAHAIAGGSAVPSDSAPTAPGQSPADSTPAAPFDRPFTGATQFSSTSTSPVAGNPAAAAPANGATSTDAGMITGSIGSIAATAGAIPISNSTGAITGATGPITGPTGAITGSTGAITGSIGFPITGATGAITGATGAITGATGAITGATGAITGSTGAITGSTSPITGATGAVPVATSTGAITGSTGSITGTGISLPAANPSSTGPRASSTPGAQQPLPITLTVTTQSRTGLLTGTFTLNQTVFNFTALLRRDHLTLVLTGPGSGLAQATLSPDHSTLTGTFDLTSTTHLTAHFSLTAG